ncbi:MAG: carbon starvation protein A [Candidatus Aminicenantes bacterium]|nr:carbon starvation protein A [Candidatus Aminicenantes bacterium]
MSSALILIIAITCFILAYIFYGRYLSNKIGLTLENKTPCHTMKDGIDYVPAKWPVLLGHHFASIAGAAPIIGPITAAVFGWIPVFLWIIFGNVFMGAAHDFASLVASARHKGRSIGKVIEEHIGVHGKILFLIFAWFTLVLVVAAFVILVAKTFVSAPEVSTASILFIMLAVVFGFSIYRMKTKLWVSTLIGVTLLILCIWVGNQFPIVFPTTEATAQVIWTCIILGYIFIASVTPVWILLQPRDYLNSNLLYLVLIFSFFGILIANPTIQFPAFSKFVQPGLGSLFPILFVTVACGAISGFHSLVASGTTSKQLNCELDARQVGYGGMLIEGLLAVIALITAIVLLPSEYQVFFPKGGNANPITLFANGVGGFISKLGIPAKIGIIFAAMAVAEFALTSLDTATRLGRFTFQEFFRSENPNPIRKFLTNRFTATFFTILPGGILALSGSYQAIWPIFGSANQLLAALALLAVSVWLAKKHVKNHFVRYPMFIMFAITLSALVVLVTNKSKLILRFLFRQPVPASFNLIGTCFLLLVALMLFAVAISLVYQAVKSLKKVS